MLHRATLNRDGYPQSANQSNSLLCVSVFSVSSSCVEWKHWLPLTLEAMCVPEAKLWSGLAWHRQEIMICLRHGPAKSFYVISLHLLFNPPIIATAEQISNECSNGRVFPFDTAKTRTGPEKWSGALEYTCARMWAEISDTLHESGAKHHFHTRQLLGKP